MKHHKQYAAQMKDHSFGLALYHPVSTRVLRPGSVGYWNSDGIWQPVAFLDDSASLKKMRLESPEEGLTRAVFQPITDWDRMYSKYVTELTFSPANAEVYVFFRS